MKFCKILIVAALLLAPVASQPALAQECDAEGYRWTLRGFGAKVDPTDDSHSTAVDDPLLLTKYSLSSGTGLGAELEYRLNCPVGLTLGLMSADLDSMLLVDTETEWLMDSADVGFQMATFGANFHLSPRSRADVFLGPFIGLVDYDDVRINLGGQTFDRSLDGETAIGLNVGVDIPFTDNGPWAFTAGLRYLTTSGEGDGFELDVDPLIATAGIAYRWNGNKCGPCEALIDEEALAAERAAAEAAAAAAAAAKAAEEEAARRAAEEEAARRAAEEAARRAAEEAAAAQAPEPPAEEREVIHFDTSSARVSNIGKAKLDEVALKLKQDPELVAMVIGHADSTGNDAINDPLSVRRAEAVKSYLVNRHNIDPSRISTEGRGSREPVASNDTADGRAENRRAVIIIKLG